MKNDDVGILESDIEKINPIRHVNNLHKTILSTRENMRCSLEHFLHLSPKELAKIGNYLIRNGQLKAENGEMKKCMCCMDDRIPYVDGKISLAGSGMLVILDMIKKGHSHIEIINFLRPLFLTNNIQSITSHQDCGAAKLFTAELMKFFHIDTKTLCDEEEIMTLLISKLESIFPGIQEIDLKENKILVSSYQDVIGAILLKYISKLLQIEYGHIAISPSSSEVPDHEARSVIIDFTSYHLSKFFHDKNINPGYFIDASLFTHDVKLIEAMCREAIIAKMIAFQYPGLCEKNKMIINVIIYDDCEHQDAIGKYVEKLTRDTITQEYPHFNGTFEIKIIPLRRTSQNNK